MLSSHPARKLVFIALAATIATSFSHAEDAPASAEVPSVAGGEVVPYTQLPTMEEAMLHREEFIKKARLSQSPLSPLYEVLIESVLLMREAHGAPSVHAKTELLMAAAAGMRGAAKGIDSLGDALGTSSLSEEKKIEASWRLKAAQSQLLQEVAKIHDDGKVTAEEIEILRNLKNQNPDLIAAQLAKFDLWDANGTETGSALREELKALTTVDPERTSSELMNLRFAATKAIYLLEPLSSLETADAKTLYALSLDAAKVALKEVVRVKPADLMSNELLQRRTDILKKIIADQKAAEHTDEAKEVVEKVTQREVSPVMIRLRQQKFLVTLKLRLAQRLVAKATGPSLAKISAKARDYAASLVADVRDLIEKLRKQGRDTAAESKAAFEKFRDRVYHTKSCKALFQ